MRRTTCKSFLSISIASILLISSFSVSDLKVNAEADEISNPRIDEDGTVTWDLVEFGEYPQDVIGFKTEPIKWRILSVSEDGKDAFVLADKGLDGQPYLNRALKFEFINDEYIQENITWKESSLRKWLNDVFYNKAFTQDEKTAINISDVTYKGIFTELNPDGTVKPTDEEPPIETTEDNVFLLSLDEVTNKEFGFGEEINSRDDSRISTITDYAKYNGARSSIGSGVGNMNSEWWLRSPRRDYYFAPCVSGNGSINDYSSIDNNNCVRPAMHIKLDSSYVIDAGEVDSQGNIYDKNDGYANPKVDSGNTIWDCVYLGSYEQSAIFEKQPIVWRVLSVNKDGTDAFLLSNKGLDCKPYHNDFSAEVVTWDMCSLRKWLNNEFYNSAFSEEEKTDINESKLSNPPSPKFGTYSGEDTVDKVFVLSIPEVINYRYGFNEKYDKSDTRVAYTTEYAWMNGAGVRKNNMDCHWELRTAGLYDNYNACIHPDGDVLYGGGGGVGVVYSSIRPAIHVNLKACGAKYVGTTSSSGGTYKTESEEIDPTGAPTLTPSSSPTQIPTSDPSQKVKTTPTSQPTAIVTPTKTPTTNPVVKKDKETTFSIKNKSTVKKTSKIKVKDKDKIKKIALNGKTIKIKKNKTSITIKLKSQKKKLKKKGKWNILKVTDKKGNTKTIKFKTK